MKSFTLKERCLIGLTLFSMFFGAGNLIFPPFLGALAGDATLPAMSGFAVTAVLFPILGVAAVARAGELAKEAGARRLAASRRSATASTRPSPSSSRF